MPHLGAAWAVGPQDQPWVAQVVLAPEGLTEAPRAEAYAERGLNIFILRFVDLLCPSLASSKFMNLS